MISPDCSAADDLGLQRQAYYRPVVDESNERFSWGSLDLDGLRV